MFYISSFFLFIKLVTCYNINNILYIITLYLNISKINFLFFFIVFCFINTLLLNLVIFVLCLFKVYLLKIVVINNLNINLLIGLSNVHPFFLYFSFIFWLNYLSKFDSRFNLYIIKNLIILNTLAIILGGFWGTGNSAWGFFWLSDPIEVLMLLMLFLFLFFLHKFVNYKNLLNYFIYTSILVLYIYLFRSGFISTRHNFFNLAATSNILIIFLLILYPITFLFQFIFYFLFIHIYFYYVLFFYLYFTKSNFIKYYKNVIFFHCLYISFLLIFFKYRENNLSSFFLEKNNRIISTWIYTSLNKIYTLYCMVDHNLLYFFLIDSAHLYSLKIIIFFFYVYISYWSFLILAALLISTLKIVPK